LAQAKFPRIRGSEVLTADDFYLEAHREIFRAMLALAEEESSIDHFTLIEELRRRNKEDAAGGHIYLVNLTDGLPRATNVAHYAKTVREKATSRQLIQLSNETMSRCYSGEDRPAEILERAESQIFRIASREIRGGFQPTRELAAEAYKEIEEASNNRSLVSGIDTGFMELNRMTGGLHRQNLVVVAAGAREDFLLSQHRLPRRASDRETGRDLQPGDVQARDHETDDLVAFGGRCPSDPVGLPEPGGLGEDLRRYFGAHLCRHLCG
jgi:hypothetical protein